MECDRLIVSIGRVPNTEGLNAAGVGLKLDERGFVAVDEDCRTNLPNVWAIGDVVRGPMLAHKAEEEGRGGGRAHRRPEAAPRLQHHPSVIYTAPRSPGSARPSSSSRPRGWSTAPGCFPFSANARARALGDTERHGQVPGRCEEPTRSSACTSSGPLAGELIAEAVVAMEFRGSAEDIGMICHAHPSLSEALKDAALGVDKRSLNI